MKWIILMALNLIGQFYLNPVLSLGLSSPYLDGRIVKIYYNDLSGGYEVKLYDEYGILVAEPTSGPTIARAYTRLLYLRTTFYKFCDGTTLREFHPTTGQMFGSGWEPDTSVIAGMYEGRNIVLSYPYATRKSTPNHWSCDIHVCNISFDLTFTTVVPDDGTSNGSVTIKAASTAGTVRFTRNPTHSFADASPSASSAPSEFTYNNLPAGTYTIYAIDSHDCKTSLIVNIPSTAASYATRWRLQFQDLEGNLKRTDIEERNYRGGITYVKGSVESIQPEWSSMGETLIFTPICPWRININLLSETDLMFAELFTQDERKFRVKHYINGSLKGIGYILPQEHTEPYYTPANYSVQFLATDQIGNLKDLDFVDDSGNEFNSSISILDAICAILRKTDINLDVRESVNIFETTMDTDPEDSSIQQAFIDSRVHKGKNCEDVLADLLINFGARLHQSDGFWNIELIEQKGSASIAYRIFNINGQYQSNGTVNALTNILPATSTNRSVLRDRSGLLTNVPSYGRLLTSIKTFFINNLLSAGTFERDELINSQITGWTFDLTNGAGISYGLEEITNRGESKTALYVDFTNVTAEREVIIVAEEFDLAAINGPAITFKMDVLFRPYFKELFSYIDVSIKVGDHWFTHNYTSVSTLDDTLLDGEYVRFYIDTPLEWKSIEMKAYTVRREFNIQLEGPVVLKIRVSNNPIQYNSISALRAQVTDDGSVRASLTRVTVMDGTVIRTYQLSQGTNSDNSPDIIRPNDYNGSTNTYVWKLDKSFKGLTEDTLLAGLLLDNIVLTVENGYPETVELEKVFNSDIKQTYELELHHADAQVSSEILTPDDENVLRLTKSYIRLGNGTATRFWKRSYEDESMPLFDLLIKIYQGQLASPSMKLSGTFYTDVNPSFFSSFFEKHLQKYFVPISLMVMEKSSSFTAELIELKTGAGGEPPNPETYEFTNEHSTEFDS